MTETAQFHLHYCRASVHIFIDYHTRMVEVQAHIGTAPDDSTIIVYPYRSYECGYWNKGTARETARKMRKALVQFIKTNGIKLSEPLEYSERWQ